MSGHYRGGCACGQVKLELSGEPLLVRQCWCRHCQHLSGGSATTNALFLTQDFASEGEISWSAHVADSGNTLNWGFCPQCGSQLLSWSSARPHMRVIRLGTLDQPHGLKPTQVIWTAQAPEWAVWDPGMEQCDGPPAPPSVKPS